jgi:hypothetical protein
MARCWAGLTSMCLPLGRRRPASGPRPAGRRRRCERCIAGCRGRPPSRQDLVDARNPLCSASRGSRCRRTSCRRRAMTSRLGPLTTRPRGVNRVPIATSLWPEGRGGHERLERVEVGRQVDVHVGERRGAAGGPHRLQAGSSISRRGAGGGQSRQAPLLVVKSR